MDDEKKLKEFLKEHGKEIVERLSGPIPQEVFEQADEIKRETARAWARIKDEPFTI